MSSILAVEDSPDIQFLLKKTLAGITRELIIVNSATEAHAALATRVFSLILLDVSLPDSDGMAFFSELQTDERLRGIPVVFLTGRDDLMTKVAAFALGADDYLLKPFNALELRARIEAKLRRATRAAEASHTLTRELLELDVSTQRAYSLEAAEPRLMHLTPREFKLLYQLARNPEVVQSRIQLLNAVWGNETEVFDRAVDTQISAIRKKLGILGRYIEAVPGQGYRFSCAGRARLGRPDAAA